MKKLIALSLCGIFCFANSTLAALNISEVRIELAKLESIKNKKEGFERCKKLIAKIESESAKDSIEYNLWKGVALAKEGHYKSPNPAALGLAKEAKLLLEKAASQDERYMGAIPLNALGILYHRVPRFSFGSNTKAEEYFKRAIAISSSIDTNWRYGEFLIDTGKIPEGIALLKTAIIKADKNKEDDAIKTQIIENLIKSNESK